MSLFVVSRPPSFPFFFRIGSASSWLVSTGTGALQKIHGESIKRDATHFALASPDISYLIISYISVIYQIHFKENYSSYYWALRRLKFMFNFISLGIFTRTPKLNEFINPSRIRSQRPILGHFWINWRGKGWWLNRTVYFVPFLYNSMTQLVYIIYSKGPIYRRFLAEHSISDSLLDLHKAFTWPQSRQDEVRCFNLH